MNWARWDFFALESLLDPDGFRVMWAWCTQSKRHAEVDRERDFNPLMQGNIQPAIESLPREFNLPKDGILRIRPLRELGQLRSNQTQEANITIKDDAPYALKGTSGDTMELEITFMVPSSSELGVRVLCGEGGNNSFTITTGSMRKTPTVGYVKPPFELKWMSTLSCVYLSAKVSLRCLQ